MPADLLIPTECGLFCPAGEFHVDPWKPVPRAVVTHAHSDHAVFGCGTYLCASRGIGVLRLRVGVSADVQGVRFGEPVAAGGTRVSLHPAGHVLGSSQVRIEAPGHPVWVISGDYKTGADATCDPFEPVACGVFLTESTFGLPIYRWPAVGALAAEINGWWRANAAEGVTSVVLAYSLGKTQRVLSLLDPSIGPIGLHGAAMRFDGAYREAGIALPPAVHASAENAKALKGQGLIVAPQAAAGTTWIRKFAGKGGLATAQASGWMRVRGRRRWRASDRGFALSDHADWEGLNRAIDATGAGRVGVTHGYTGPLSRWLRERGLGSFVVPTRWEGEAAPEGTEPDDAAESPAVEQAKASGEPPGAPGPMCGDGPLPEGEG